MLPMFTNYPEIVRTIINYSKSVVSFNWARFKKIMYAFLHNMYYFLNDDDN